MLIYFLVINEQFSDQCTELTEWRLERGGGGRGAENQRPGPRVLLHIFRCNKLNRVGQGFCVFGIQGRFKSGIRYIAA